MAVDMFLVIKDVPGETQDDAFAKKGGIDLLAWSWGLSQSGTTHMGTGGGAGKVNIQDISFTKYVDKATPNLMKMCCTGTHIAEATITVRKAGGTALPYIEIVMQEVMVTAISTGGSGGEERLTENVTLNFAKVKFNYTPQDGKGGKTAAVPMGWDIAANVPLA